MQYIKQFTEISKNDVSTAGGKGASLGEMTQAGISVPPGFVVLASAFDAFLAETDINVEINAILDSVNTAEMHTVEFASEKIRALILGAAMPVDIADEIVEAYQVLCNAPSVIPESVALDGYPESRAGLNLDSGSEAGMTKQVLVAVRSSATAEDSASVAWAGQLDSFLNTTKETLLQNVQKCWASLFTPRAIFYGFEKGFYKSNQQAENSNQNTRVFTSPQLRQGFVGQANLPLESGGIREMSREQSGQFGPVLPLSKGELEGVHNQGLRTNDLGYLSVAVVVQVMVQSEVSGIAFSVHPVTQDRNQLIIEAGYGLGEAIVSGQVTPDSYVVTKSPLAIIDKNISTQDRMLVRSVSGGSEWVSCPPPRPVIPEAIPTPSREGLSGIQSFDEPGFRLGGRNDKTGGQQKLSDSQILELSQLILKIENHYGFPCDIEWAWTNGQFYITQSRPITTLSIK